MVIRLKTIFFIILGLSIIWFLYVEREILTPFILAGIFAYIFNPFVNFFSHKLKLPRSISVVIIYLIIMSILMGVGFIVTSRILQESLDLRKYIAQIQETTHAQVNTLPDWARPAVKDMLFSLERSKIFSTQYLYTLFPQALSRAVSFFIFLFAGFYFLKEGGHIIQKLILLMPQRYRFDTEVLIKKINAVFKGYLRGQIFLIFFVSLVLFILLSILGVKFALILALFSGFAEIIPVFGPIVAALVSSIAVLIFGTSNFDLTPVAAVVIVVIMYFVVRQIEDYFVIPHVMGKVANLHPLLILFAVIAGGHIGGMLGYILAVPIAASIKLGLEFSMDQINAWSQREQEIAEGQKKS